MRLTTLGNKVKRNFESQLQHILKTANVTETSKKINDQKLRDLADLIKAEIPGSGFAIMTFDIENNQTCANYLSNLTDDFMIKALEMQLENLKRGKTPSPIALQNSGS
jgi:flagellar motor switch protein FliG